MRALVIATVVAAGLAAAASAQSNPTPSLPTELAAQLAQLNQTLERIADAMTRQSKLDLVVRRIELGADRVAALEKKLEAARSGEASLRDERDRLTERKALLRRQVQDGVLEATTAQLDAATQELDAEIERLADRVAELAVQITDIENRLVALRADHEEWQAYLDELIDAL